MKPVRTWKVIVALVLVFIAGGVGGSAVTAYLIGQAFRRSLHFEKWANSTEATLTKKLSLTPDQRVQTHAVIEDMEKEFGSIFGQTLRQSGELIVRSGHRIDAFLTPEQQRIHAAMKADLRRHLRQDLQFELPAE